jgi:hypothetical protein
MELVFFLLFVTVLVVNDLEAKTPVERNIAR